jgi:cytochrome c1
MHWRPGRLIVSMSLVAIIFSQGVTSAEDIDKDPFTGLAMVGDWELVRNNCVACHSARLVTQQRGDKNQWLAVIRWMQKKQNLWEFEADTEARIIAYLAENYPPREAQRRRAIPRDLMPSNPYAAESASSNSRPPPNPSGKPLSAEK